MHGELQHLCRDNQFMAAAVNINFALQVCSDGVCVQSVARVCVHFAQNREEALDFDAAVWKRQEWYHDPGHQREAYNSQRRPQRKNLWPDMIDLARPPVERWRHHPRCRWQSGLPDVQSADM